MGEAGMVVTNDSKIAEKVRTLRNHGQSEKYRHRMIGVNSRMDGLQAAVLSVKLKRLDQWNETRRKHAGLYRRLFDRVEGIGLTAEAEYAGHVYHMFIIRVKKRDEMIEYLKGRGVICGIHYPFPIHLMEAYAWLGHQPGSFPAAEKSAAEVVSLPMYPELTPEQIETVAREVIGWVKA